mmetsp:Transcript_103500/g.292638  ORF Transcript_103500/g.292638 Transcript_103500/m.292638 type:complete len:208 (-) Transcript_103500:1854-2477(-)
MAPCTSSGAASPGTCSCSPERAKAERATNQVVWPVSGARRWTATMSPAMCWVAISTKPSRPSRACRVLRTCLMLRMPGRLLSVASGPATCSGPSGPAPLTCPSTLFTWPAASLVVACVSSQVHCPSTTNLYCRGNKLAGTLSLAVHRPSAPFCSGRSAAQPSQEPRATALLAACGQLIESSEAGHSCSACAWPGKPSSSGSTPVSRR